MCIRDSCGGIYSEEIISCIFSNNQRKCYNAYYSNAYTYQKYPFFHFPTSIQAALMSSFTTALAVITPTSIPFPPSILPDHSHTTFSSYKHCNPLSTTSEASLTHHTHASLRIRTASSPLTASQEARTFSFTHMHMQRKAEKNEKKRKFAHFSRHLLRTAPLTKRCAPN